VKNIENLILKEKIDSMNESSKKILDSLFSDAIIEINYRNRLDGKVTERIVLVFISLLEDENYLEFDKLSSYEKSIICKIISKGIASIFVDDEYLDKSNQNEKLFIIEDLINLLCYLTNQNKSTIKRLVKRDIKVYSYLGWRWDFL